MKRPAPMVYCVDCVVLVDDVKPIDIVESLPHLFDVRQTTFLKPAVPSVVRLQPLNRCALLRSETTNLIPLVGGLRDSWLYLWPVKENGEHRIFDGAAGHIFKAPIVPDMHLKDEQVERAPEIMVRVAKDEAEVQINRLQLADIKAILKSISIALHPDGVECVIEPPVEFVLKDAVVLSGTPHLGYSAFEAS